MTLRAFMQRSRRPGLPLADNETDSGPTFVALLKAKPFKVGNRTFITQDEAEQYANKQADKLQTDVYVIDRRNGEVVATYEP